MYRKNKYELEFLVVRYAILGLSFLAVLYSIFKYSLEKSTILDLIITGLASSMFVIIFELSITRDFPAFTIGIILSAFLLLAHLYMDNSATLATVENGLFFLIDCFLRIGDYFYEKQKAIQ